MLIDVLQTDIDKPIEVGQKASENCPLARAIQRELRPRYRAFVALSVWGIMDEHQNGLHVHSGELPHAAMLFRRTYDHRELFTNSPQPQPFSFPLSIPSELCRR